MHVLSYFWLYYFPKTIYYINSIYTGGACCFWSIGRGGGKPWLNPSREYTSISWLQSFCATVSVQVKRSFITVGRDLWRPRWNENLPSTVSTALMTESCFHFHVLLDGVFCENVLYQCRLLGQSDGYLAIPGLEPDRMAHSVSA